MYNRLLDRQIKRYLKGLPEIPEELKGILTAISDSYNHYEADRALLERSLEVSSSELNMANSRIREQLSIIEQKNKNILDSINYALKIQQAILPSEEEIKRALPDSFIFYRPKDVVSGDFYWFGEQNGRKLVAAVDCTGHGVPGAFMSMIGTALLNEIVNEKNITEPGSILNSLRENIIRSLKQTGAEGESKDGMDIALCAFENGSVHFAGANNPLWLIRGGQLSEIKGDKQPIGIHTVNNDFSSRQLELNQGDCLYIFTDGFADQFGGKEGKKFKYKQLEQLLLGMWQKPMAEQKGLLASAFENWKQSYEQVDDVLVLGIKV